MSRVGKFAIMLLAAMACACGANDDASTEARLSREAVSRFTALAMACIPQEYPNKLGQLLSHADQLRPPRSLHPAFFGCYDWHSSVHGHWMLVKALKAFDEQPDRQAILDRLAASITEANIEAELSYFEQESKSWERTYGWAWLLQLQNELNDWEDPRAAAMAEALQPLSDYLRGRYMAFLPIQTYPVRTGVHPNTAFGMSFAYDYAIAAGDSEFATVIKKTAYRYFFEDENCPISWEPSGEDFLSPCLEEAALMSRVMPKSEFRAWLSRFLPGLGEVEGLRPANVSDRSDPKIAHLDGLNLSRAWNLLIIANAMDDARQAERLRATANRHLEASLPFVTDEHYVGSHWLGSFALYALTRPR